MHGIKSIVLILVSAIALVVAPTAWAGHHDGDHNPPPPVSWCVGGTTITVDQMSGENLVLSIALAHHLKVYVYTDEHGTDYSLLPFVMKYVNHHWVKEYGTEVTFTSGACPIKQAPPQVNNGFLCYSQWQVNPGVYPIAPPVPFGGGSTAQSLMSQGYWLPVAETSVPTQTKIGGYYLFCNGANTGLGVLKPTGNLVDSGGVNLGLNPALAEVPGIYPEAK